MIGFRIANPHERPNGLNLAVIEKSWPHAKDSVPLPDDPRIFQVHGPAQIYRVSGAANVHVANNVLRAVRPEGLQPGHGNGS